MYDEASSAGDITGGVLGLENGARKWLLPVFSCLYPCFLKGSAPIVWANAAAKRGLSLSGFTWPSCGEGSLEIIQLLYHCTECGILVGCPEFWCSVRNSDAVPRILL